MRSRLGGVTAFNQNNAPMGWNDGVVVECIFMPSRSAKLESLYIDLASSGITGTFGLNYGYDRHPQVNIVSA